MSWMKFSNSGRRSWGPGLASGCPWKLKAGRSVRATPCRLPSKSERCVATRFAGSVDSSTAKPWFCEVIITSQNHGFAVDESTLPENLTATHRSLFDGSLQGVARTDRPAFSFQGHPEASPGPHDLRPLFEAFIQLMVRRLQDQLRQLRASARR